jgi:hypothetical protein
VSVIFSKVLMIILTFGQDTQITMNTRISSVPCTTPFTLAKISLLYPMQVRGSLRITRRSLLGLEDGEIILLIIPITPSHLRTRLR